MMKKMLALLLAALMTCGCVPILSFGMIGMAAGDLVSIALFPGDLTLKAGDCHTFCAVGRDADGAAFPLDAEFVHWSVSDPDAAVIESGGRLTVKETAAAGTVFTVNAVCSIGGKNDSACCTVTVAADPGSVHSVGIVPDSLTLRRGQDFLLSALGYAGANKKGSALQLDKTHITWSSKNDEYVRISSKGVVTALRETKIGSTDGGVEITAVYQSGTDVFSDSIRVYVQYDKILPNSISVIPKTVSVLERESTYLIVEGHGSDGNNYALLPSEITWTSSDTDHVVVSDAGEVTAKAYTPAPVTVFASYTDSEGRTYIDSCTVMIERNPVPPAPAPVKALIVVPNNKTIEVGDRFYMQAAGLTADYKHASLDPNKLSWTSGDPTNISITDAGLVTGLAPTGPDGVTITAAYETTDDNGDVVCVTGSATIIIPYPVDPDLLRWNWSADSLLAGETYSYAGKYVCDREVELTVSDPSLIVDIDQQAQTFRVVEYPGNAEFKKVSLILTAKDAPEGWTPAVKQMKVYNDVPLTAVVWDRNTNPFIQNANPTFPFYGDASVKEANKRNKVAEGYWYEPTKTNATQRYMYYTVPGFARSMCDITVYSSDERIMKVDKATRRLIPVGNGKCTLTIAAKTPRGVVKTDTVTVAVVDSLYTPIDGNIALYVDNARSDMSHISFLAKNTVSLGYKRSVTLVPGLEQVKDANGNYQVVGKGTFDHETFTMTLEDGREFVVYEALGRKWTSSDPESVPVTVEKDGAGKATAKLFWTSEIELTLTDYTGAEPVVYSASAVVKISTAPNPALAIWAIIVAIFTFRWKDISKRVGVLFHQ